MTSPVRTPIRQRGATLIIGLVLLLVLSVLAVSTMSGASFGLTMVGNAQYSENAFQMAETGVDLAITAGGFTSAAMPPIPVTQVTDVSGDDIGSYAATTAFQETTAPPAGGYSIGNDDGTFQACHFQIVATGQAPRGASSTHVQEFYLICPGGS
jgi:Tfp pilus assembly protein PilX